jgi:Na+-driven multidrug efflux pump
LGLILADAWTGTDNLMRNDNDDNYISTGKWMLLILVPSIPVIGWIMVIVLAFTGSNQTRKNYFRALIAWIVLLFGVVVVSILILGYGPILLQHLKEWQAHHR